MHAEHQQKDKMLIEQHDQLVQTNMRSRKLELAVKSGQASGEAVPMDLTDGRLDDLKKEVGEAQNSRK